MRFDLEMRCIQKWQTMSAHTWFLRNEGLLEVIPGLEETLGMISI